MVDSPRKRPHPWWNLGIAVLIAALPVLYLASYSPVMVLAGPGGIISAESFHFWYSPVLWLSQNVPPLGFLVDLHTAVWWYILGRD